MSMLEEALALAANGWPVFPIWGVVDGVCACGKPERGQIGKHPRCWQGHNDATTDEAQIRIWWGDGKAAPAGFTWECSPDSNIGIAVPDGVLIVDIDPRNGGDATFLAITQSGRSMPDTLEVASGSGGAHFYYRVPEGMQYPKTLNEHGGPGIDLKQLGGYVLAPPSLHKSGGSYEWADADQPMVDAPQWLLALGTPRKARTKRTIDRTKASDALSPAALKEGDAIVALLEPHYVEGSKHAIATGFGGYCKKQGKSPALVEYVISQLPSDSPEMRIESALTFYGYDNPTGWQTLKEHLPGEAVRELERTVKASKAGLGMRLGKTGLAPLSRRRELASASGDAGSSSTPELGADGTAITGGNPLDSWTDDEDPTQEIPPLDYVCEYYGIAEGKVSLFGGFAGSGKSPLGLLFAVCVASGKPFLGQTVKKRPVVFLMYEGERLSKIRRNRICAAMGVDRAQIPLRLRRAHGGFTAESLGSIRDAALWYRDANDGQGALFIHDTYTSAMRGVDQNAAEYAEALWMLGDIGDETGCLNLALGHLKKQKDEVPDLTSLSGHNAIASATQTAIGLLQNKAKPEEVTLYPLRVPEIPFKPTTITWLDVKAPDADDSANVMARREALKWGLTCKVVEEGPTKQADPKEALAREVLKLLEGKPYGHNTREICALIAGTDAAITSVLKSLAAAKVLTCVQKGNAINYVKANT